MWVNYKAQLRRALSSVAFRVILLAVTGPQLVWNIYEAHKSYLRGAYFLCAIQLACFIALGVVSTASFKIWREIRAMSKESKMDKVEGAIRAISKIRVGGGVKITVEAIDPEGNAEQIATCSQTFTNEGVHNQITVTGDNEALIMAALSGMARSIVNGVKENCNCEKCDAKDCDNRTADKKVH